MKDPLVMRQGESSQVKTFAQESARWKWAILGEALFADPDVVIEVETVQPAGA